MSDHTRLLMVIWRRTRMICLVMFWIHNKRSGQDMDAFINDCTDIRTKLIGVP
jgi:hypothetical protein